MVVDDPAVEERAADSGDFAHPRHHERDRAAREQRHANVRRLEPSVARREIVEHDRRLIPCEDDALEGATELAPRKDVPGGGGRELQADAGTAVETAIVSQSRDHDVGANERIRGDLVRTPICE